MNQIDLQGNRAVITGGAQGIGYAIAERLLQSGAAVSLWDRDADLTAQAAEQLSASGTIHHAVVDVTDLTGLEAATVSTSEALGRIDIFVANAGIAGPTANLQDVDPGDWDRTIAVNLNGMFYSLKAAIPQLQKSQQPSIINIASSASFFGFPLRSPYTAAKWAVIGLTKTLAMELGGEGIRVNAICPGSVSGDRIDQVIKADALEQGKSVEEIKELYVKQVSMKTFVEPEDVANLALFLTSDYGRYISGQAIGLDGHTEGLSNSL